MLAFFPSSTSAHAQWPYVCVSIGKGAEGFLKAGNQPIKPTPFYPTHRAGTGPALQHLAKTGNCNYLRKCLPFEVQLFSQRGVGEKNKTEGLRLHHTSLMLILSRMLEKGMQFKEMCMRCVCVCLRVFEGEWVCEWERQRSLLNGHSFFTLFSNKEQFCPFWPALLNYLSCN